MPNITKEAAFGQWKLTKRIGGGHSSFVWQAVGSDGRVAAIKLLKARYAGVPRRYERFRNEIDAMKACADIPGVLPLWDSETPADPKRDGDAWLVSPLAKPLSQHGEVTVDEAVRICGSLARTLAAMHERGRYHRDIKPENVFFWNGRWHIGDFGIAAGPVASRQTREGEKLGPIHYIAPEMLNDALTSHGGAADVYSLAKLLWKLATGQRFPVPGWQLRDHPALNVSGYVRDARVHTLDALIDAATHIDPGLRPSIRSFTSKLPVGDFFVGELSLRSVTKPRALDPLASGG